MRIVSVRATNFASYKEVAFDFTEAGLALISGPTGAGKSTIMDLACWTLFGVTVKGGKVDDIRRWAEEGDTESTLSVENRVGDTVVIYRSRGSHNDMWFRTADGTQKIRGKDLSDTQTLLNKELNMTYATYVAGSYFHEFSESADFFTSTARSRRNTTEQLVDFKFINGLTDYNKIKLKAKREEKANLEARLAVLNERKANFTTFLEKENANEISWNTRRKSSITQLERLLSSFEYDKEQDAITIRNKHIAKRVALELEIEESSRSVRSEEHYKTEYDRLDRLLEECGDSACSECGALKNSDKRMMITKQRYGVERDKADNHNCVRHLHRLQESYKIHMSTEGIEENSIRARTNGYSSQLSNLKSESNPHTEEVRTAQKKVDESHRGIHGVSEKIDSLIVSITDLELLLDIINEFRGMLINNTIHGLETHTNMLLETYFDAEIRVEFSASDADKIEVTIAKDGNECNYTQLSKGQRQLLRLCFSTSVMRAVSMHRGVDFNVLFFDEVFSGLDENMKAKGFQLLEGLAAEHESVFCIDHSEELKTRFSKRYEVGLVNGTSVIHST